MSEKFKISNLDLYYGDFHALKDINMSMKLPLLSDRAAAENPPF
jgi:ABC-type phosphate transport system ATPase subunit